MMMLNKLDEEVIQQAKTDFMAGEFKPEPPDRKTEQVTTYINRWQMELYNYKESYFYNLINKTN